MASRNHATGFEAEALGDTDPSAFVESVLQHCSNSLCFLGWLIGWLVYLSIYLSIYHLFICLVWFSLSSPYFSSSSASA